MYIKIKTVDAVGHIICHDITQIIPGETKGVKFFKGHIVKEEDIEVLLSLGKDLLYVYENIEGIVHEDEAAERLKNLISGDNLRASEVKEGKINLISEVDGVLKINSELVFELNMIDQIIVSTKFNNTFVRKGDSVAATRVIPLAIAEEKILLAEKKCLRKIINVKKLKIKKVGLVTTGNEVFYGRIVDRSKEVIVNKLNQYQAVLVGQKIVPDEIDKIAEAINEFISSGVDLVFCTGGMSVDASDITPTAIEKVADRVIAYGMPILPGSMTMLAYNKDIPIVGLPAGVLFSKRSSVDLLLPRLLCEDEITRVDIANYGNGGLL